MDSIRFKDIVCCPSCKEDLNMVEDKSNFECMNCKVSYKIIDNIPVLLKEKREPHTN